MWNSLPELACLLHSIAQRRREILRGSGGGRGKRRRPADGRQSVRIEDGIAGRSGNRGAYDLSRRAYRKTDDRDAVRRPRARRLGIVRLRGDAVEHGALIRPRIGARRGGSQRQRCRFGRLRRRGSRREWCRLGRFRRCRDRGRARWGRARLRRRRRRRLPWGDGRGRRRPRRRRRGRRGFLDPRRLLRRQSRCRRFLARLGRWFGGRRRFDAGRRRLGDRRGLGRRRRRFNGRLGSRRRPVLSRR